MKYIVLINEFGEKYKNGRLHQFEIIEPSHNQTKNVTNNNINNNTKVKISILLDGG